MKRAIIIVLIITLIVCGDFAAVSASTFSARIQPDRVHVTISSNLSQNITSLFERKIILSGDSLANATRMLERSIQAKSPGAYIKDSLIHCTFTNSSIEVKLEFNVFAVVSRREEVVTANLTWRAFSILDDIVVGNVSCNAVGKSYFLKDIPRYENMTGTRFYENRTFPATTYRAKDIVGNITMLRFKALEIPLSKWERTYDVARAETRYGLKVGRMVDLAARRELNSSMAEFGIWMDLSGEIVVSGYARLKGEAIVSEAHIGPLQVLVLATVVVPLMIVIAAHMIEKRKKPKVESKRR